MPLDIAWSFFVFYVLHFFFFDFVGFKTFFFDLFFFTFLGRSITAGCFTYGFSYGV